MDMTSIDRPKDLIHNGKKKYIPGIRENPNRRTLPVIPIDSFSTFTDLEIESTPLLRSVEPRDMSTEISTPDSSESGGYETWYSSWKYARYLPLLKICVIFGFTASFVVILATAPSYADSTGFYYTYFNKTLYQNISKCDLPTVRYSVVGAFANRLPSPNTENLSIYLTDGSHRTQILNLPLLKDFHVQQKKVVNEFDTSAFSSSELTAVVTTTSHKIFSFGANIVCERTNEGGQVVIAAIILASVYILIIFELVHRALAAMIGALAAIAMLAFTNERPSLETVTTWIDYETLTLLFGMMVLVAIFCESGFFDWAAFKAYKLAKGDVWTLITILCVFAAVISAFLDNVTTVLLMTPVTIRLSEVLNLDPRNILISLVIFSNIGGTATAVGDPPNVIIVSNKELEAAGIQFHNFTVHMLIGVIFIMIACYLFMRFMYRRKASLINKDPPAISELKHEIEIWRRTVTRIIVASREESMVKALMQQKVVTLENLLKKKMLKSRNDNQQEFHESLIELENRYCIRDKALLIKAGVVLSGVILLFFITSFIDQIYLTIGWIAVIGAMILMVLSDYSDIESLLHKVEWATLMFFASLFILMKALEELGLIKFIGDQLSSWISSVNEGARLPVAIILILWIAALASSFIDNIPFTTAMVPVLIQLHEDTSLNIPLRPLVWALAFGTCLGGNGTLIGASANVVCAGIAEQHGYGFSFIQFFKMGFPMMLLSTFTAMCYLLIVHCTPIAWNYW